MSFFENILLFINGRLSKVRLVHTYDLLILLGSVHTYVLRME